MRIKVDFPKNRNYTEFIKSQLLGKEVMIMFELNSEMSAKLREKRARKNITLELAAKEIGISSKTLGGIENEKIISVRKTVYKKIVDWLINEIALERR